MRTIFASIMDVFVGYLIDFLDLIEYNRCVELSLKLPEWEQESFALAGILTFTDKVIDETTKRYMQEKYHMTLEGAYEYLKKVL